MKIFLHYVGDPGFQSGDAEDLGVHQTTVSKIIADTATKTVEKAPLWIKFPSIKEELQAAKADWQVSYKFPCAIGALGCTHIPIRKSSVHRDEYINRKGFPNINKQCVTVENRLKCDCFLARVSA
jgi:energy-converting hydrogenase Eha subunit A